MKSEPRFVQPWCNPAGGGSRGWAFSRVCLKLALLGGQVDWAGFEEHRGAEGFVVLSECEECGGLATRVAGCERGLRSIEEKLDRLLELQVGREDTPAWAEQSERRVIAAVEEITAEVGALAAADLGLRAEADRLRGELGDLADGADRFLAGLQSKLAERDKILFFDLIASVDGPEGRRVKTYAEIGERLGVTRQAIEKRYRKLRKNVPELGDYVDAIRRPEKAKNFSEMSPSERRKQGIEESYNYNANR